MHVKMSCPKNESMWKKRAERYKCQNKDIYHCLHRSRLESVKVSKAMYYTYSFGFKRCNIVQHFKLQEKYNENTYF